MAAGGELPCVGGKGGEGPDGQTDGQGLPHRDPPAPAPPHVTQREHNSQEPIIDTLGIISPRRFRFKQCILKTEENT